MFLLPLLLSLASSPINATLPDVDSLMQSSMRSILRLVPFNGQIAIDDRIFTFGDPNAVRTPLPSPPAQQETPNQGVPQFQNLPQEAGLVPSQPIGQNLGIPMEGPEARNPSDSTTNLGLGSPMEVPQPANPVSPMPMNFESRIPDFGPIPSVIPVASPSLPNIASTEVGSTFAQNSRSNFNDEFSQSTTPAPFGFPRNEQISRPETVTPTTRNQAESPLVVMPMIVSPDKLLQSENAENPSTTPLPGLATGSTIPIPALFASTSNNDRSGSESRNATPIILTQLDSDKNLNTKTEELDKRSEEEVTESTPSVTNPVEGRQLSNDSVLNEPSVRDALPMPPLQDNANINQEPEQRKPESLIPFPFEPTLFDPNPKIPTLAELDAQLERKRSEGILKTTNGLVNNKK